MMKQRFVSALTILATFLATLTLPAAPALADIPAATAPAAADVAITGATAYGDLPSSGIANGGTLDEGTTSLWVYLSQPVLLSSIPPAVTVTNSKGETLPWQVDGVLGYPYGTSFTLNIHQLLTPGETYTITLRGGPVGIVTEKGESMAADATLTLHAVAGSFVETSLKALAPTEMDPISDGALISRDTVELYMSFNRRLFPTTTPNVTVTDSLGRPATVWKVNTAGDQITFQPTQTLPENETYKITVRGGPDGVRSSAGVALPADITFTVHTDGQPVKQTVSVQTNWLKYQVMETETYRIKAAAGPFSVQTAGWADGERATLLVKDPQTGTVLLTKELSADQSYSGQVNLPAAGVYDLAISPAKFSSLTLEGMNLEAPTVAPALRLPAMAPYETHNAPFTLQPQLTNPEVTGSAKVTLGDQVLMANALQPDGKVAPVTIDPTKLADGIYNLTVSAVSKDGASGGAHTDIFLVDRVDAFADVPSWHWERPYVEVLHDMGVISGRDSTHFAPAAPVTRAEFAKMTAAMLGLAPSKDQVRFADVPPGDWSQPYLQAMFEAGLLKGDVVDGQTYLYPTRAISRAEAATIVGRAAGIPEGTAPATDSTFTDYTQVPTWARISVLVLAKAKWINGFPDGSFGPSGQLQRGQAARLLANFIGMK